MGDTDFPSVLGGGQTNNFKQFLESYLPKVPDFAGPPGYFRQDLSGKQTYQQSITGQPDVNIRKQYGQTEGGPVYGSLIAQGIPVGQDPMLPMSQEEFKDWVLTGMERNKPVPPLSPELRRKIDSFRSRFGIGSV